MSDMVWAAFAFLYVGAMSTVVWVFLTKHAQTMKGQPCAMYKSNTGCVGRIGALFLIIGFFVAIYAALTY